MKRVESLAGAGLLSAALLMGACGNSNQGGMPTAEIVPNDPAIAASFDSVQQYWDARGVAPAPRAMLTTARSGLFACDDYENGVSIIDIETTKAVACDATTIVISEKPMADFVAEGEAAHLPAKTIGAIVVAHEYGHLIQGALGLKGTPRQQELRADCQGGMAVADIDTNALAAAKLLYGGMKQDAAHPAHPSAYRRSARVIG